MSTKKLPNCLYISCIQYMVVRCLSARTIPASTQRWIITDCVVLWKIQKFDWLISVLKSVPFLHECHFGSAWMSFWPAMPELLPGETRIHSSRVEPEKNYWFQINKNLPLFDRAMICSNNSMLWRTASLFTAVIQVTTRVTCDAWRVHINNDNMETVLGEVQRLSKHEISGAFSGRIH